MQWRKNVEAEQARQADEIEGLQFLLARLITTDERALLERFSNGDGIIWERHDGGRMNEHLRSLHRLRLIAPKPSFIALRDELQKTGGSAPIPPINDMYDVTDSGRKYLEMTAELPDIQAPDDDPYRPV